MLKLTDEQLSKVLFAHNCGLLIAGGYSSTSKVCLVMCAFDKQESYFDLKEDPYTKAQQKAAGWFDKNYKPKWTIQRLIQKLTEAGLC